MMRISRPVLIVYVIVGIVVAAARDYFDNLDRLKPILSALLAVLLWPLVLAGVDIRVD